MKNYYYDTCYDCDNLGHCFKDWEIAKKISDKTINEKEDGYYLSSGSCNSYYPDPYISTFH